MLDTDWTNKDDVLKAYEAHKNMSEEELREEVREYRAVVSETPRPMYRMSKEMVQVANLYGI
jgi:hypothetical protein